MKKTLLRILLVLLCVVLVAGIAIFLVIRSYLGEIDRFESTASQETVAYKDVEPTEELQATETFSVDDTTEPATADVINILLVGQPNKNKDLLGSCEAVLLCSIRKNENKIVLTWVEIPGLKESYLSDSGFVGGISMLNRTLEHNFGVVADYNIVVNTNGFSQLIDKLDGISVELLQGEADCLNRFSSGEWSLKAGKNQLTGEQAFHFTRMTQSGTEHGRNDRQKRVLAALAASFKNVEVTELKNIALDIAHMVSTDMSDEQILQLVADLKPLLKNVQIVNQSVPMEGQYTFTNEEALVMSSSQLSEVKDLIAKTIK